MSDAQIRLSFFATILAIMTLWELIAPRRALTQSKLRRWGANLSLVVLDTLAVRFLVPITAIAVGAHTEAHGIGLLNQFQLSDGARLILTIAALDLIVYLHHLMFHAVPLLWRFHRVHHADRDIDVTTGVRFHPIEIVISLGIKIAAIYVVGANPWAILIFEIILNSTAMFNHSNVRIPVTIDRVLRLLVVTPDMHRVHHSIVEIETDSNFGFNFPWWDRIFGTYQAQPKEGHLKMTIGLRYFQEAPIAKMGWILLSPFYAVKRSLFRG